MYRTEQFSWKGTAEIVWPDHLGTSQKLKHVIERLSTSSTLTDMGKKLLCLEVSDHLRFFQTSGLKLSWNCPAMFSHPTISFLPLHLLLRVLQRTMRSPLGLVFSRLDSQSPTSRQDASSNPPTTSAVLLWILSRTLTTFYIENTRNAWNIQGEVTPTRNIMGKSPLLSKLSVQC